MLFNDDSSNNGGWTVTAGITPPRPTTRPAVSALSDRTNFAAASAKPTIGTPSSGPAVMATGGVGASAFSDPNAPFLSLNANANGGGLGSGFMGDTEQTMQQHQQVLGAAMHQSDEPMHQHHHRRMSTSSFSGVEEAHPFLLGTGSTSSAFAGAGGHRIPSTVAPTSAGVEHHHYHQQQQQPHHENHHELFAALETTLLKSPTFGPADPNATGTARLSANAAAPGAAASVGSGSVSSPLNAPTPVVQPLGGGGVPRADSMSQARDGSATPIDRSNFETDSMSAADVATATALDCVAGETPQSKVMCKFFASGGCDRGQSCPFKHDLTVEAPTGVDCSAGFVLVSGVQNLKQPSSGVTNPHHHFDNDLMEEGLESMGVVPSATATAAAPFAHLALEEATAAAATTAAQQGVDFACLTAEQQDVLVQQHLAMMGVSQAVSRSMGGHGMTGGSAGPSRGGMFRSETATPSEMTHTGSVSPVYPTAVSGSEMMAGGADDWAQDAHMMGLQQQHAAQQMHMMAASGSDCGDGIMEDEPPATWAQAQAQAHARQSSGGMMCGSTSSSPLMPSSGTGVSGGAGFMSHASSHMMMGDRSAMHGSQTYQGAGAMSAANADALASATAYDTYYSRRNGALSDAAAAAAAMEGQGPTQPPGVTTGAAGLMTNVEAVNYIRHPDGTIQVPWQHLAVGETPPTFTTRRRPVEVNVMPTDGSRLDFGSRQAQAMRPPLQRPSPPTSSSNSPTSSTSASASAPAASATGPASTSTAPTATAAVAASAAVTAPTSEMKKKDEAFASMEKKLSGAPGPSSRRELQHREQHRGVSDREKVPSGRPRPPMSKGRDGQQGQRRGKDSASSLSASVNAMPFHPDGAVARSRRAVAEE